MPPKRKPLDYYYTINPATGCWIWKGARRGSYGMVHNPDYRRGLKVAHMIQASRYVYELLKGPIPCHLQLDHLCRNRACVNPDHLEIVTNQENIRRGKLPVINEAIAREIRSFKGKIRQVDLARHYGISQPTISQIMRGVTWK